MEVPTTAAYVICVSVAGPVLSELGLDILQAHLFVFWFALISTITPPVCGAVFIAAGMVEEDWLKVASTAMALGIGLYLIPFAMIANPTIVNPDSALDSVFGAGQPYRFWRERAAGDPNQEWAASNLIVDVNDLGRYPQRCTSAAPGDVTSLFVDAANTTPVDPARIPRGIDFFGGVFGKYLNITSTNGFCVYRDDRPFNLEATRIYVMPGPSYYEGK